ncbi:Altered inheritance of mitochondria protein 6 [Cadophora gregata]|uniref:Altered inheritance of mitochondria protein 6 n=1 Tax=Cadophora gregata TaxID=51156 RepID=UPI0026DB5CF6|nr:Altered inheritance of mitochondria protein 6 [Cadophora gregata]KAK0117666.1 Altered inheritance of mitochondria protein 6 [Cadophora gregata]KAK0122715.1 Altered inheritance of mitochondria protein 6 [Cadophora gregata f. sp. sojae]
MVHIQLTRSKSSYASSESTFDFHEDLGNHYWKRLIKAGQKQNKYSEPYTPKKRLLHIIVLMIFLGFTSGFIWLSLLITLPRHHDPKPPSNRVSYIVDKWKSPLDSSRLLSTWSSDFTRDITPMSCHSHNDYKRTVPLCEALAAGCTSVEADIFLPTKTASRDLLVGHKSESLTQDRTLQSLYIDPLITTLENLNNSTEEDRGPNNWSGVYQSSPNTTLTLLLDFKSNGAALWPYVDEQLSSLRSKKWLTHWSDTSEMTWAPIIVVATGNAPFDILSNNRTYRDIFYDAPLDDISNAIYNNTNSHYASVSMSRAIGRQWFWRFSSKQRDKIGEQVSAARSKGLVARYWDTPTWPVTFKDYVSEVLIEKGVGTLNVDRFSSSLYFPLLTGFGQNRLAY